MSSKITLVLSSLIAYILGILTMLFMMPSQNTTNLDGSGEHTAQSDNVVQNDNFQKESTLTSTQQEQEKKQGANGKSNTLSTASTFKKALSGDVSTQDFSEDQAQKLITAMPDLVLNQYMDKFLTEDLGNKIQNKRQFASRAVNELFKKNDGSLLQGEIILNFSSNVPDTSVDTSVVGKYDKIYAHFNTFDNTTQGDTVFIKWVHNDSGQVLLFQPKPVTAESNKNWVNIVPNEGWQTGSYDVKVYQFNDELAPIAQLTYDIQEVSSTMSNNKQNQITHAKIVQKIAKPLSQ